MKKYIIVLICCILSINSYAQTTLSLSLKEKTLKEAFATIEKKSSYSFFYTSDIVDEQRKVSIDVKNVGVDNVLNLLLKGMSVGYEISGNQIVLYKKVEKEQAKPGNELSVKGQILDETGSTLPGVHIVVKGTKTATVSDFDGNYQIKVAKGQILVFNYLGYEPVEVTISDKTEVDILMKEDTQKLDELVVVGYGTQKKASVVGAITTVKPSQLNVTPSKSISNNLAGMVSGVLAVQRSGDPWSNGSDFWIRGISTLGGNRNPLVLIDGVERDLNNIDVEEIESFSVLKDASASAVYGVRGANGVIMINTKRGIVSAPKVNFRVEKSFSSPTQLPQYIGAVEHIELLNEIFTQNGRPPFMTDTELNKYKTQEDPELYPDVDWWGEITKKNSDNLKINATINGGTNMLRYAFVLGYFDENGLIKNDPKQTWDSSLKVKRYNLRSNVDVNISPTTLVNINLGGFLQTRNGPPGAITDQEVFSLATMITPFAHPPVYSTGQIPKVPNRQNPWAYITQRGYEVWNQYKLESSASLEQDLKFWLPGLKAKVTFAFDKLSATAVSRSKNPDYYNPASARDANGDLILTIQSYGQEHLGYSTSSEWGNQSTYMEGNVNYSNTFNDVHNISTMFIANRRNYDDGSPLPFRSQGVAGRFSYTFDSRYIGEFNFGYNGSENFAPGKRYGFFPSFALGWMISEEKFMEHLSKTISKLKLRGSWGVAGNSDIGGRRFAYITTIDGTKGYYFGPEGSIAKSGWIEGEIGVSALTWETVQKSNIGFELGLWGGSLDYIVDFFKEKRSNIFIQRGNIPGSAGFNKPIWDNYGKVDNKGIDMSLNFNKQLSRDWRISALANYTYARNKIIEMDEPLSMIGTNRAQTGHPVGQHFGLIAERLFTEEDFNADGTLKAGIPAQKFNSKLYPGDIKYVDIHKDGEINELDKTAIGGTLNPETVYGFGATVQYKKIDFGFFFQGSGKTTQILGGDNWLPGTSLGVAGNIFTNINDRWTPENPSQDVFWPRLSYGVNQNNTQASTWWLRDMSFLRLRNIELGYTCQDKWTKKYLVDNFRIFCRATNILTFSDFKLWDPELGTSDGLRYPLSKGFSVGISINFL